MAVTHPTVRQQAENAKLVAPNLARTDSATRDRALVAIADLLEANAERIREANAKDLARAEAAGTPAPLLDRLSLAGDRVTAMALGLRDIVDLPDPLGEVMRGWTRPNGLRIEQIRVPLGLVGFIYESRPNVTVEATGLCLKSGNALLLRGSSAAWESNQVLISLIQRGLESVGLPGDLVQGILNPERDAVDEMLGLTGLLDVVIPRGGAGLIQRVIQMAKVPVIETGVGNCHIYVDASADEAMATRIVVNGKCQRPGVCNATETLLVHVGQVQEWLPNALLHLKEAGIEIRGDERVREVFPEAIAATDADWETEFLDRILAVKVVDSLEAAIAHIGRYGTKHSEAIVTNDYEAAERFLAEVDAAAVYVNASTRFTDGGEFGFGAEVGISTQKLHARGPMGLKELTTTKYLVRGNGQVR
ncbi:Gamma-glutamyl phosphate reductase [compost metagenome]